MILKFVLGEKDHRTFRNSARDRPGIRVFSQTPSIAYHPCSLFIMPSFNRDEVLKHCRYIRLDYEAPN